jgi:hypothetical protein
MKIDDETEKKKLEKRIKEVFRKVRLMETHTHLFTGEDH